MLKNPGLFCTFLWLAGCIPSILDISGIFCESLDILDAKIGCVFVCCVVASLAFPASSASGTSQFINRGLSTGIGGSRSDFNMFLTKSESFFPATQHNTHTQLSGDM